MLLSGRHILIALLVLTALATATVIVPDIEKAVAFTAIDDAAYSLIVAENLVRSGRLTYDGASTTNGFHPLFMLLMTPIYWLVSDPWLVLKLVYCLVTLLTVLSCWFFGRLLKSFELTLAGFLLGCLILFANLRSYTLFLSLKEAPLLLLIFLFYLTYVLRHGEKRYCDVRTAFGCGLLIGLAFLARADSFLLGVGYGIILLYRVIKGHQPLGLSVRVASALAAGSLLFAAPYLLANWLTFGHLNQVSGYMKSTLITDWRILFQPFSEVYFYFIPRLALILNVPPEYHTVLLFVLLAFGGAAFGLSLTKTNRAKMKSLFAVIGDFFTFSVIHLFTIYFFGTAQLLVSPWIFIAELLSVAIVAAFMVPRKRIFDWALVGIVILAVVAQSVLYPGFVQRKTMTWAKIEVGDYIRENLPADARLSMFDSGITAYFARRGFVGLNGYIGDFPMADLIKAGNYTEVAENYGVQYLVLDINPDIQYGFPGQEVFRGDIRTKYVDFSAGDKCFAVYKIDPPDLKGIFDLRYKEGNPLMGSLPHPDNSVPPVDT